MKPFRFEKNAVILNAENSLFSKCVTDTNLLQTSLLKVTIIFDFLLKLNSTGCLTMSETRDRTEILWPVPAWTLNSRIFSQHRSSYLLFLSMLLPLFLISVGQFLPFLFFIHCICRADLCTLDCHSFIFRGVCPFVCHWTEHFTLNSLLFHILLWKISLSGPCPRPQKTGFNGSIC